METFFVFKVSMCKFAQNYERKDYRNIWRNVLEPWV